MNNFQTILVAVFLAFFVFAVMIFSGLIKIGEPKANTATPVGKVVIWGTFPTSTDFSKVFQDKNSETPDLTISYIRKDAEDYTDDLIQAFASDTGPDLFFITPDMAQKFGEFIYKVPYTSYAEKTYKDAFIDGASVYLTKEGVLGFPLVVDPMVLYYNKDIFANEGLVSPPEYWDELYTLSDVFTEKRDDGTILQSMIALGRYDNIKHSKDILATLLLQNGNNIVAPNETGGYISILNDNTSRLVVPPVEQILSFFIEFSNPSNDVYSWNRSLPNSFDMFTSGKLVMYLGRASELFNIEKTNPNLSFDVTDMLQTRASKTKRTYGDIYAVAVNKKSKNITASFGVASLMTNGDMAKDLSIALSLPPASKALLKDKPENPYIFTFFNSSIITRTWLDPDKQKSDTVFNELIQNIISNRLSVSDAVTKAHGQLEFLNVK